MFLNRKYLCVCFSVFTTSWPEYCLNNNCWEITAAIFTLFNNTSLIHCGYLKLLGTEPENICRFVENIWYQLKSQDRFTQPTDNRQAKTVIWGECSLWSRTGREIHCRLTQSNSKLGRKILQSLSIRSKVMKPLVSIINVWWTFEMFCLQTCSKYH